MLGPAAPAPDLAAADLDAAAAGLDAAADLPAADLDAAAAGLGAAADLLAAADGLAGGESEPDAKAAAGTATAAAATTPARTTRRLRTDMPLSFMDRMHPSPATPAKTSRPATLKQPRKPQLA
jgi:hypothetical protein